MAELEKLFEGAYNYLDKGVNYSQENFTVLKNTDKNILIYTSEILTRVSTGEFLKINVGYEVNSFWAPLKVVIHKTLGPNFATETFIPDYEAQLLTYEFTNNDGTQTYSRNIVTRYQIATPAICSSMIVSMTKKFDSMSRNACILVTTNNNWEYKNPFEDQPIFIEYKTHEKTTLKLNGQDLSSVRCLVYQHDSVHQSDLEVPTTFYISKNIGIPYLVESGDIKIQIRFLNKTKTSKVEDFFR
ncbi:MAG: hypothetical protein ACOYL6_01795 [Bacteriovoracaceae bacterium]